MAVMLAKSILSSACSRLDDILVNRPELLFEVLDVVLTIRSASHMLRELTDHLSLYFPITRESSVVDQKVELIIS
jgi:hypothetical protein